MVRTSIVAVLYTTLLTTSAWGTLLVRLSDEELCRRADGVVRAEVLDVESFRDARRGRVFTNVTLGVLEYLKGQGPDQILVETAGGTVGDLDYRVLGSPRFALGEEVVLFLEAHSDANRIIGMAQGKMRVLDDEATGRRTLERDLTGVALVDRNARSVGRHGSSTRGLGLDELRTLIRTTLPRVPAAPRALTAAPFSQ